MKDLIQDKPETSPKIPLRGLYRVCEVNPVYDCGWIFVSNDLEFDEAVTKQESLEKRSPHLRYEIVPV